MSINYCTIGKNSIDGFCGNQRAKVLSRLIHEAGHDIIVVPPTPTPRPSSGGTSIGIRSGFDFRPDVRSPPFRREPEAQRPLQPQEQPFITVSAEILGMKGQETLEVSPRLDFVTVTDLEINEGPEITVNISDMEI